MVEGAIVLEPTADLDEEESSEEEDGEEALSERELAWEQLFEGIQLARQGFAKMTEALKVLHEMENREP